MGELETEYAGQVKFVVVSAEDTAKRQDEIEEFGFSDMKHGLVAFSSNGEALVKLPGHNFGKDKITEAIEVVLAANA